MNINNISEGQVFKNYKELCVALGEIPKTSNSKNAQMKEWERYFYFTKQGHKIIIEEVYDLPKEKQDLRSQGNNAAPYIDDIEELILNLLIQDKNKGQLFLSRGILLKELKMINENYTYYKNRKPALSKFTNIHVDEINDFYTSSNTTFKSNLETALNRLQKQSLIFWRYALTVCYVNTHVQTTTTGHVKATKIKYINEDGEEVVKFNTAHPSQQVKYREATEDEIKIIIEIEREMLKQYSCKDKAEIFKRGLIQDFYKDVNDILFDKTNIIYYYNSYEILFNDEHVQERLTELKLNYSLKNQTENNLNVGVMERLSSKAKSRHEKAKDEIDENILDDYYLPSERKQLRSSDEYLINNKYLTQTLISKDFEPIF
jgi:hypothetical protein